MEIKEVVNEVVAEAKTIEAAVVNEVKAIEKKIQELSAEEKLAIREIENEYLKAQMELKRLSEVSTKCQKDFTANIENLTRKYVTNPAEWVFDHVQLKFTKKK